MTCTALLYVPISRYWQLASGSERLPIARGLVDAPRGVAPPSIAFPFSRPNLFANVQVDGVWHTGIVYKKTEYYYGAGIQTSPAGATPFGTPLRVISLGCAFLVLLG